MSKDQLLPRGVGQEAQRVASMFAHRLADERIVREAVQRSATLAGHDFHWGGPALYGGHAGSVLVFCYAAKVMPETADRWHSQSREVLRQISQFTHEYAFTATSLGAGSAGLALVLDELAVDVPGYQSSRDKVIAKLVQQVAAAADTTISDGVNPIDYDVVSGASGVLGYLANVANPDHATRQACWRLIDYLIQLCRPANVDQDSRHWYVASRFNPRPETSEQYPHGYVDLGLAHGLAGPLAALSLAWQAGYKRVGQRNAIAILASYLLEMSSLDKYGRDWPRLIKRKKSGATPKAAPEPGPMSWCYGAPGICSAILDAADTLEDPELRSVAVTAFDASLGRALSGDIDLSSSSLCHGWSGLLAISQKFAEHSSSTVAEMALEELTRRILDQCHADHPLVVKEPASPGVLIDSPSLLDGAAGVPLALWSVSAPVGSTWRRALLIDRPNFAKVR